ncbi:MAG: shikimate kinase [Clostridia bacterium]|nr:shikimate kinase [Clostridia bacterium]
MKNIILIGMPGAGKSTIGVILAKTLGVDFIDTDMVIQNRTGELLQTTLQKVGVKGLLDEEEAAIKSLDMKTPCVVATGGSAVLRETSMKHLKKNGVCVYLYLPYSVISHRVNNRDTRGIAAENNETLKYIYDYRTPFYEKYADYTVDCRGHTVQKNVSEILKVMLGLNE